MEAITPTDAQAALQILADAAIGREAALAQYPCEAQADTDEENDSDSPILDTFHNKGGGSAIFQLKTFPSRSLFSSTENSALSWRIITTLDVGDDLSTPRRTSFSCS